MKPDTTPAYNTDPIAKLRDMARAARRKYDAPTGQIWVCMACGKTARNRRGDTKGWDESCAVNAVLCREASLVRGEDGYVIKAEAAVQ